MNFLLQNFPQNFWINILLSALTVWSLIWKGLALWHAAQRVEKYWFIALLVLNTFGILEIIYLFFFAKDKLKLADIIQLTKKIKVFK